MRRIVLIAVTVMVAAGLLGWQALAQDTTDTPRKAMEQCPCYKMMKSKDPNEKMAMMKKMGMTDEEIMKAKAAHMAPLYMDQPAMLMGAEESLKLTDEQKTKLMEIDTTARTEAMKVLTDDQKKMLGDTSKSFTMKEMMMDMHQKMMKMKPEKEVPKEMEKTMEKAVE